MANAIVVDFRRKEIDLESGSGVLIDAAPRFEKIRELSEASKMARALPGLVTSGKVYLEEYDPEKDTYVVFQRPSRREAEQLATMRAKAELVWNTEEQGTVRQRDGVPLMIQESEMVAMCMVECNIPDENDKLVFVPGASCRNQGKPLTGSQKQRFYKIWGNLPDELATEITDALREFHPPFDFRAPDEGEE